MNAHFCMPYQNEILLCSIFLNPMFYIFIKRYKSGACKWTLNYVIKPLPFFHSVFFFRSHANFLIFQSHLYTSNQSIDGSVCISCYSLHAFCHEFSKVHVESYCACAVLEMGLFQNHLSILSSNEGQQFTNNQIKQDPS